MTPTQARASLDRMLVTAGQACELQKAPDFTRTVRLRAAIRDYRPAEILGGDGLQIGDSKAIISATEINASGWPVIAAADVPGDARIPVKGDRLKLANGRVRTIIAAWPAPYVQDELIRIELTIR